MRTLIFGQSRYIFFLHPEARATVLKNYAESSVPLMQKVPRCSEPNPTNYGGLGFRILGLELLYGL